MEIIDHDDGTDFRNISKSDLEVIQNALTFFARETGNENAHKIIHYYLKNHDPKATEPTQRPLPFADHF